MLVDSDHFISRRRVGFVRDVSAGAAGSKCEETRLTEAATQIASIAIERQQDHIKLREREARISLAASRQISRFGFRTRNKTASG